MEKYVAYYRLSKIDSKSAGLGLNAQRQIVEHYYKGHDIKSFTEIKSAKNITERPQLQQAIAYCLSNDCTLVVAKLDRLSRNVDDCRHVLHVLGSRLKACDIPGQLDKFTLTLFAAFAERERELISLRTKNALSALKKNGKRLGKNIFLQSDRLKGTKATITKSRSNENNVKAMDLIHEWRVAGKTFQAIADRLNLRNDKTAYGKRFTATQVRRLHLRSIEIVNKNQQERKS
jgi:DNA invertase Pin-like site-specific DNA recombinase